MGAVRKVYGECRRSPCLSPWLVAVFCSFTTTPHLRTHTLDEFQDEQSKTRSASGRGKAQGVQIHHRNISNGSCHLNLRHLAVPLPSNAFRQMFVFGEVQDPLVETVNLVEDIVRSQVLEIVSVVYPQTTVASLLSIDLQVLQARQVAAKRGGRNISAEDLIFLIRYDRAKVNRLRTYLSWKDVRKNAKDSDNAGGNMDDVMEEGGPG